MPKHAYLIMAHNEFPLLKKLIVLLDDSRNDLFVHVDKKAKGFETDQFLNITKKSSIQFVPRQRVTWGGFSQINAELVLLKEAVKGTYDYYHLLSGADLPIKCQDEIHEFFSHHTGMEFLFFDEKMPTEKYIQRVKYFHILQEFSGHTGRRNPLYHLNRLLLAIQKFVGVDRIKGTGPILKKGTVWFSITHNLAQYVVSQEHLLNNRYKYTFCADEIYLHTLAWNSDFKDKIIASSLRYIDWDRGQPYTFRMDDYAALVNSSAFWARKFSEKIDAKIVDAIYTLLST